MVGVSASTIRTWHERGYLPHGVGGEGWYRDSDVIECALNRMPRSLRLRLYDGWARMSRSDHDSVTTGQPAQDGADTQGELH